MPSRIEDYALLSDRQTAALVSKNGSIDWLCFPRFDSDACFAALLGDPKNGRWLLAPKHREPRTTRKYREGTTILETTHETPEGAVRVIDFMPSRGKAPDIVRIVEGLRGAVPMRTELVLRFNYGSAVPWVTALEDGIQAVAGPERVRLATPVETRGEDLTTVAEFTVREGERVPFVLTWSPSHEPPPERVDAELALRETEDEWREWLRRCKYDGPHRELVHRSLLTLRSLIYEPTGGIVAAPTTSLPERIGGVRNWDYRYCWLRDATFTLTSLLGAGFHAEAHEWRDWLVRAVGGDPSQLQIMYGLGGERRLSELTLPSLPGYEGSQPVRIGNAASGQLQLDVYGEVMDALHQSRRAGLGTEDSSWSMQRAMMDYLETIWEQPDEGLWEIRGPRKNFTHSKVMAWVAFDRAVKGIEKSGLEGPKKRWEEVRDRIHASICKDGFDRERGTFVQAYGSKELDASLLLLPLVGFLPATDPRMVGTVKAVEKHLLHDGFVKRYGESGVDGLPGGEGAFLACSFWLADNYALQGRHDEAGQLFDRLARLANDVGLLSEEYDPEARRLVGNFPQAFSHVALVNTALNLAAPERSADRKKR